MSTRDPNQPYYGADPAELRAQGVDPDEYEANRIANQQFYAEQAAQQAIDTETEIAARALQAVEEGEMEWAEAATALASGGFANAHAVLVQAWQAEEGAYKAEEAAYEIAEMDADQYAQHFAEQQSRERANLAAQVQEAQRQVEAAKLQGLIDQFQAFTQGTPGVANVADAVEKRIVQKIAQEGSIPETAAAQSNMIESSLREHLVLSDAEESLRQQVDQEWRIQRKQNGKSGDLMTSADLARAEAHYKTTRFQQLAEAKEIDVEAFKPGPSAEDESAAISARFRAKNEKSDEFHRTVSDIRQAGIDGAKTSTSAPSFASEKEKYKEALARAEAEAGVASPSEIKSAYTDIGSEVAQSGGFGPDGTWPDELGPVL